MTQYILLLAGCAMLYGGLYAPKMQHEPTRPWTKDIIASEHAVILGQALVLGAFLLLLWGCVRGDFTLMQVFANSNTTLPVRYRIAATWSSYESSLLFWLSTCCVMGFWLHGNAKARFVVIAGVWALGLQCFANPLARLHATPQDGMGFNPLLQDVGVMIHPPVLYMAYSCYCLAFVCASVRQSSMAYLRAGNGFMALAIGLGGWWAYRELGWGGYWFFDPIENISLMVFLAGVAAHHMALRGRESLAGAPFVLSLLGTFFARSGMVTSVHSFAEAGSSYAILVFAVWCGYIAAQMPSWPADTGSFRIGVGGLWVGVGVILLSLVGPAVYLAISGMRLDLRPDFFVQTLVPILLVGLACFVWHVRFLRWGLMVAGLLTWFISWYLAFGYTLGAATIYASYVLHRRKLSAFLGHVGLGVLVLGICCNVQFGQEWTVSLAEGQTTPIGQYMATFTGAEFGQVENYAKQVVCITISDARGNEIVSLRPQMRLYLHQQVITSDAYIWSTVFYDWYAVVQSVRDNVAGITIYYKPAVSLIWLGMALMAAGFFVGLGRGFTTRR